MRSPIEPQSRPRPHRATAASVVQRVMIHIGDICHLACSLRLCPPVACGSAELAGRWRSLRIARGQVHVRMAHVRSIVTAPRHHMPRCRDPTEHTYHTFASRSRHFAISLQGPRCSGPCRVQLRHSSVSTLLSSASVCWGRRLIARTTAGSWPLQSSMACMRVYGRPCECRGVSLSGSRRDRSQTYIVNSLALEGTTER